MPPIAGPVNADGESGLLLLGVEGNMDSRVGDDDVRDNGTPDDSNIRLRYLRHSIAFYCRRFLRQGNKGLLVCLLRSTLRHRRQASQLSFSFRTQDRNKKNLQSSSFNPSPPAYGRNRGDGAPQYVTIDD